MSLSGALYNAFSGIKANSRAAALVSTNISNATTESYGRRSLGLAPAAVGTTGGVRITGVVRNTDPVMIADRRFSDAQFGQGDARLAFAQRLELMIGETGTPGALTSQVTAFENALITAASNPASTQRLETAATTADSLAKAMNKLSDGLQESRELADRTIASNVQTINEAMIRLDQINADVASAFGPGDDVSALLDERQRLIDSVSDLVPLRVVGRDRGEIAIFTSSGAALLDGRVNELGFDPANTIAAGMTQAGGALSGLTLAGIEMKTDATGLFGGGKMAAQFEIRDELAVEAQADLDAMARDLAERLGSGGPDATIGATDPGLFTDGGLVFDAVNEAGFSGRIALNDLVAPASGGAWRLRDGLGAAAQGPVGDARLLQGISDALSTSTVPASTSLAPVARGFADHISEFSSSASGQRVRFENAQTYNAAQNTSLRELELANGVDTDQELQRLMQIEQHYTANAKVMSVVDDLMQRLMNI